MSTPHKPLNVDVAALKQVLTELQQLQGQIQEGRPGSWDSIGDGPSVQHDLRGMQENVAQQMGDYYGDVTTHVRNSWTTVQNGIATLATLVQFAIDQHSHTDGNVATTAHSLSGSSAVSPHEKN